MSQAMSQLIGREDQGETDFRRFEALFAAELDELRECAGDRGVDLEEVAEAYFLIEQGARPMVKHSTLCDHLNRDWRESWEIASVLVDFGESHLSKQDGWWWVIASEFIANKCSQRSIGLKQYMEMRPDLVPVQNDMIQWYQTRQMNGNLQRRTMREIKVTHGERLQEQYYPEKPLDTDEFHDHIIARYIKTAQDEIVEALNLSY